jgi:protein-S-isoprenylcysteine O-methyltransferase Ste14
MKSIHIPPVYFLIGCLIIILTYWLIPQLNIIPFPFNLSGLPVLLAGLYPLGQSYKLFSKHRTPVTFDDSTSLVKEGIYKRTRNPMYLGMIALLAGLSISFGNVIGLAVPILFFLIIDRIFIPFEEKKMEISFGKDYHEYLSRVKRWI